MLFFQPSKPVPLLPAKPAEPLADRVRSRIFTALAEVQDRMASLEAQRASIEAELNDLSLVNAALVTAEATASAVITEEDLLHVE